MNEDRLLQAQEAREKKEKKGQKQRVCTATNCVLFGSLMQKVEKENI